MNWILQVVLYLCFFLPSLCLSQNPALDDPGAADMPPGFEDTGAAPAAGVAGAAPGVPVAGAAQQATPLQGLDIISLGKPSTLNKTNDTSRNLYIKKRPTIKTIRVTLEKLEIERDKIEEHVVELDQRLAPIITDIQIDNGRFQQITSFQNESNKQNVTPDEEKYEE